MSQITKIKISKEQLKLVLRPLLFVFGSIIALGIVANILVDNPYAHRIIRVAINDKVHQYTNLRLDFKAVNVKVLPMELSLYGFNLFIEDDSKKTETIASASQIHTSVSLWSLLFGIPKLKIVEVTDLKVRYPFVSQIEFYNQTSEPKDPTPKTLEWPPKFELPLYGVEIRNGSFGYLMTDEKNEEILKVSLEGVDLDTEIDSWRDISGGLHIAALSLSYDGSEVLKRADLKTDFILDETELFFETFRLKSRVIEADGRIETVLLTDKNALQALESVAYLEFNGDLQLLDRFLGIPDTDGAAKGTSEARFAVELDKPEDFELKIKVSGEVRDGRIYEYKLFDSKASLTIDLEGISFDSVEVIDDGVSYGTATGVLGFNDKLKFKYQYSPRNLPLSKLLSAILVDFTSFDGTLNAQDYVIQGQGFPFRLQTEGQILLNQLDIPEQNALKLTPEESPNCDVSLVMDINANGMSLDQTDALCSNDPATSLKEIKSTDESETGHMIVKASGRIDFEESSRTKVRVESESADLRLFDYFSGLELTGRGSLGADFYVDKDQFVIGGITDLLAVQVSGIPLGDVKSQFRVVQDVLFLDQFSSKINASSNLQLSKVRLELDENLRFSGRITGSGLKEDFSSAVFKLALPNQTEEFKTEIEFITADLTGELLKPFLYTGRFNALFKNSYFEETKVFDSLRIDLNSDREKDVLKYFSYQIGSFVLNATGQRTRNHSSKLLKSSNTTDSLQSLGFDRRDAIKLNLGSTHKVINLDKEDEGKSNLQDIPLIGQYAKEYEINGRLSINAKLEGDFQKLSGSVQTTLSKVSFFESEAAPFTLEAFVDGNKIDTIIRHSGNALTGRFDVDLGKDGLPYQLYVRASRFDLRAFTPLNFHNDARNYAYLTASLKLDGSMKTWWDSIGRLEINDLKTNYTTDFTGDTREIKMSLQEPLAVRIDQNGWNIEDDKNFELAGNFVRFLLSTEDNNPPEKVGLKFSGEVDLSGISLLTTQIESSNGLVTFGGDIRGSVDEPLYDINIQSDKSDDNNISIGIADLRPPFEDVDFDVKINNKRMVLNNLSARKGSGTISALGNFNFESGNQDDSQIDVTFNEASIILPAPVVKIVEGAVSGNLFIRNFKPPFDVRGNIRVDRGRTIGEIDPRKEVIEALRQREFTSLSIESDPFMLLNINIDADNSIIINNRNMQATLSTNLKISGSNVRPIVNGQVEIDKGKFIYKRDFNLTQGVLTFDDPVKLDPKLDINAVAEVQNYRVFISITGRASEPVVDLSTDPATREDGTTITKLDIITLLSTGTLPDINRNEINSQTVARTEALNIFAGQLEEPVEKLFDLAGQNVVREVYIDTYSTNEGRPLARLNMPLNLGKNWDMIFRVDQESWKLSSEYSLHENISVLGSFDGRSEADISDSSQSTSGDTGVDVKFRFAFP